MKKITLAALFYGACLSHLLAFPITLTTFGTSVNTTESTIPFDQATSSVSNATIDAGDVLYGEFPTPLNLTGITGFTLTLNITSFPVATNFFFEAFDPDDRPVRAQFAWSSFSNSTATITAPISFQHPFIDLTNITFWNLTPQGGPGILSGTFYSAQAIPEPSTLGLLGMSAIAAYYLRRRRSKALH